MNDIKRDGKITRDKYKSSKVPEHLDAIIIGSGIGGLSTAGFLSRAGYSVLVLEQHDIAGGATHTFKDHGFEHETGIHYIGNIQNRQKVLDLITKEKIQWSQLGKELGDPNNMIYDELFVGKKGDMDFIHHCYRAGKENFIMDLLEKFPKEENAIYKYVELIEKVSKKDLYFLLKILKPVWLRRLLQKWFCNDFYQWIDKSAAEVIRDLTSNEELIAILCGQFGDYGPPPENASFFIHASIVNHYLEGGYYPIGGSSQFAKQIIPIIMETGGRVLVKAQVTRILLDEEDKNCIGVQMENGDEIYAPIVISDAGARNTYSKLLPEEISNKQCNWDLIKKSIPRSCSFMFLFVGLKGEPTELGLRSANFWVYPQKDYTQMLEEFKKDPLTKPMPLFIASASAKDPSWSERNPGKSSMILLTMGEKEMFKEWEDQRCKKRDIKYRDIKEKMAKRMLDEGLFRFYPDLRDKVEYWSMGTPLTISHYLGSPEGEAYGLDCNPSRFDSKVGIHLEPQTGVEGLYLTGQDVCTLGFTGALMGGCLTASEVLGYGSITDIITGRNLINDLESMLSSRNN